MLFPRWYSLGIQVASTSKYLHLVDIFHNQQDFWKEQMIGLPPFKINDGKLWNSKSQTYACNWSTRYTCWLHEEKFQRRVWEKLLSVEVKWNWSNHCASVGNMQKRVLSQ